MSQINSGVPDKEYWRSIGELEQSPEFKEFVNREFPKDASVLGDDVSRRTFIKIMGASFAFAGLTGCAGFRRPKQVIRAYARTPENLVPGRPNYYATSMALGTDVVGLLIESHEGRPTKVEGNPSHPGSLGAASAINQASVLDLYDPDRLKRVHCNIPSGDVDGYGDWLSARIEEAKATHGAKLAILVDTNVSPTMNRVLAELKLMYKDVSVFQYSALNDDNAVTGIKSVSGKALRAKIHFDRVDRLVAFGADFLGTEPGNVVSAKEFATRRDPDSDRGLNRLYMFESHFTVTGGKADHRFRIQPGQMDAALAQIAVAVFSRVGNVSTDFRSQVADWSKKLGNVVPAKELAAIVDDLVQPKWVSAIVVGSQCSPFAHAVAVAVNAAIGATEHGVSYYPVHFVDASYAQRGSVESIRELTHAIKNGDVDTLFILGGNPVFTAPSDIAFGDALKKLKHSLHLTLFPNETSHFSQWVVPKAHFLEAWGDAQSIDGTVSVVQPLITPLYNGTSDIEWVSQLTSSVAGNGYDEVRKTLKTAKGSEKSWRRWLHEGVVSEAVVSAAAPDVQSLTVKPINEKGLQLELVPDFKVYDGRFTNNGWLQELPHPVTKLTWDNAALIGVDTAQKMGLVTGDLVNLKSKSNEIEVAVFVQPGTADDTVVLSMGYGRRVDGRIGQGTGFNGYPLRSSVAMATVGGITIEKTGKKYTLATTQEHGSMEDRKLVRAADLMEYEKNPEFAKEEHEGPPMKSSWPERAYDTGNQWGMSIDLSKCTGCNACLIACQSENNIPIVGKSQVANGREMHWIRLDRYYEGNTNDPQMVQQPMTCLQCENAPCEQVCPVAATVHSEEGLNDMAYNRCIGTKYCSNNCPVKVRRFNFFDFHQRNPQSTEKNRIHFFDYFREPDKTVQMQFNPDVTLRMRGVMEKCTYCVQRIQQVKIRTKNEGRAIVDGEIKSACMQSCPSDAIVFGNILDPESKVAKLKKNPRDYHILSELYLKARTTYLASVRNPHPTLVEERA